MLAFKNKIFQNKFGTISLIQLGDYMSSFNKDVKESLITASLVGLVVAVSSNAHANNIRNIHFADNSSVYIGAGVGYNRYILNKEFRNSIEKSINRGSIKNRGIDLISPVLGIKFQDNYGLEFGYQLFNKIKFNGTRPGKLMLQNGYLDSMGYMPFSKKTDIIGGVGIGYAKIKENSALLAMGGGNKYSKLGFRIKIGVQYYLSSRFNYRAILGYQNVGSHGNKRAIKSIQYMHLDFTYLI